jgi:hypothetical protein
MIAYFVLFNEYRPYHVMALDRGPKTEASASGKKFHARIVE